jgi:hypothetical protein
MLVPDSKIFQAVIDTLNAGLKSRNVAGITVQSWYQPRLTGAPNGMALLLSLVTDHAYGFLGRYNSGGFRQPKKHSEVQAREMTIQITGSVKQPSPANPLWPYSSGDLAKIGRTILQSDSGRNQLRALGFGIERIQDVRQPYFKDESDQFEQSASFDFVLAFNQVEETITPIVTGPPVVIIKRV